MSNSEQILKKTNERIKGVWGDTPLKDPANYLFSPIVQSQLSNAYGLELLQERFQRFIGSLDPYSAEDSELTYLASLMGSPRKLGVPSYVTVVIKGKSGASLDGGTTLISSSGVEWKTANFAVIGVSGLGYVDAFSPVGNFDLRIGELRIKESVDGVDAVTNSSKPELGGDQESDECLRRRLLNIRPHWRVNGTSSGMESSLIEAGAIHAKAINSVPDCLNDNCDNKLMVAVIGGNDNDIAQSIYENAPFSVDRLVGNYSAVVGCQEVRFQRMCPVLFRVKYWLPCDCSNSSHEDIVNAILYKYSRIVFSGREVTPFNLGIDSVSKIEIEPVLLNLVDDACAELEYVNPITGETERNATEDPNNYCYMGHCFDGECFNLPNWSYPVIVAEYIEQQSGCPCSTLEGCGCGK